jgi:SAM-dependent methyltransferase
VLDIGGWGRPFTRADWVIDLMPYDSRGEFGRDGPGEERFSADTWIQRDICDREPYPFADKSIDFVVCAHTLEDVRDPVWVCSEMVRVAKAGYIEVPSRLEEQSYGFQGHWVGWGHHRWLVDVHDGRIDFVFKHHVVHGPKANHFPPGFWHVLPPERHVQTLWWEGTFEFGERIFIGPDELDPYLADFVRRHRRDVATSRRLAARVRNALLFRLDRARRLRRRDG